MYLFFRQLTIQAMLCAKICIAGWAWSLNSGSELSWAGLIWCLVCDWRTQVFQEKRVSLRCSVPLQYQAELHCGKPFHSLTLLLVQLFLSSWQNSQNLNPGDWRKSHPRFSNTLGSRTSLLLSDQWRVCLEASEWEQLQIRSVLHRATYRTGSVTAPATFLISLVLKNATS